MTSRVLSCNKTILKKNLSRFWPTMLFPGILMLLINVLPMMAMFPLTVDIDRTEVINVFLGATFSYVNTVAAFFYAVIAAGCVFGYLHKAKSSNMLHAFPLRREELFFTGYVSGLLLFAIPLTVIFLLCSVIALLFGCFAGSICLSFLHGLLEYAAFFSVAAFCMQLCGRRGYAVVSYFLLSFLPLLLEAMVTLIIEPYLYGVEYDGFVTADFVPFVAYLDYDYLVYNLDFSQEVFRLPWVYTLIFLAVGLVLWVLTLLLYRRRQMENVGQSIAFPGALPIVRFLLSFCAAVLLGSVVAAILTIGSDGSSNRTGKMIIILLSGLLAYFLLEMALRRTQRVFSGRTLLGYLPVALTIVALSLCFRFDLFNIRGFVPEVDQVQQLRISSYEYDSDFLTLRDPENIRQFTELHEKMIHKGELSDWDRDVETYPLYLVYTLDNGDRVCRSYYIPVYTDLYESLESFFCQESVNLEYIDFLEQNTDIATWDHYNGGLVESITIYEDDLSTFFALLRKDAPKLSQLSHSLYLHKDPYDSSNDEHVVLDWIPKNDGVWYGPIEILIPGDATETCAFLDSLIGSD